MGRFVPLLGQPDGPRSVDYAKAATWLRRDLVNASDTTKLTYAPPIGQGGWKPSTLDRGSCVSGGVSTIEPGNAVTFTFEGISISVQVVKASNGAPYSVSLDGNAQTFDSFASSQQCSTDFQANNLAAGKHTVIITHQGNSTLLGSGRSTLFLSSVEYNPTNSHSRTSTPVGAIVGAVVGVIILISLAGFFYWWFKRRKLKRNEDARIVDEYKAEPRNVDPFVTPLSDFNQSGISNNSNTLLQTSSIVMPAQPARRTKADYFNEQNGRYGGNNTLWTPSSAAHQSNPNTSNPQLQQFGSSHSGVTESSPPTTVVHQYPPGSATENSSDPGESEGRQAYQIPRNPRQTFQHQSVYAPAPSEAGGESVAIDRSDYIPPPSYSPPSADTMPRPPVDTKAVYAADTTSPWHSQSSHQPLSSTDVDVIARRVYDLMRSGSSAGGSSAGGDRNSSNRTRDDHLSAMSESVYSGIQSELSSSDAGQAQVQQAVRRMLARDQPPVPALSHQGVPKTNQKPPF